MIKMSILSKLIYRLNPFFKKSKLQQNFLDIAKIVQSFYEKEKETTLKKNNKIGGINLSSFKAY